MARLPTVALLLACLFMLASQTALADMRLEKRLPTLPSIGLDQPSSNVGIDSSSSDPGNSATDTAVVTSSSSTPVVVPPDSRTSSVIPTTSAPAPSSTPVRSTTSTTSSSSVESRTSSSSRFSSSSMVNSTSSIPTKSNTNSYSFNPTSFVYNSTVNGHIVTITSTTAAPKPTATVQGERGHVNTLNVIIVISAIGGTALLSTVAFAWIKLYKGRRAGWDDDELMNVGYGDNSDDPFKNTLNQYHRS